MGRDQQGKQLGRPLLTGEDFAKGVEESKRHAGRALGKILPLGAQVAASAVAYSAGITATQLVGFVLKVSCSTPVLGPTLGLLGVGLANVLAGQASRHTRKMVVAKSHPLQPGFWETPQLEDMVLDAVLGACIFKAMGGRFSSVMPSDLTKPGALAFESIPARNTNSEAYAAPSVKRELARIFKRDGCHHCGSRRPPVIGDHMPPNKMMAGSSSSRDQLGKWLAEVPVVGKMAEAMGVGRRRGPMQRFYPQCQRCSIKQATAVRNGKRLLVLHLHWPRARGEHLSGIFVGLRYNAPDLGSSGAGGGDRRRSGKWASLTLAAAAAGPTDAFPMQQCPLAPELSGSSFSRSGWASGNTNSGAHYLQVAPLMEGGAAAGSWQQQQEQHHGMYAGAAGGSKMHHTTTSSKAGQHTGATQQQRQQRGVSGPGDERLPDQNPAEPAAAHQGGSAMMMVSLEGWGAAAAAASPTRHHRPAAAAAAADVAMAPEHAKARAEAAFERHFAPGLTY